MSALEKSNLDAKLCYILYKLISEEYDRTNAFLCYYPLADEINLLPLYEMLLADEYTLYFPKTADDLSMEFYRIQNLDSDLKEGAFHVMEPIDSSDIYDHSKAEYNHTFMILPGSVFDESCHRMGYGKGYYDRYLSEKDGIIKCAPAYDFQVLEEIPSQPHDVPMDMVITPTAIFYQAVML